MPETHLSAARQTLKLGLIKVIAELFPGETFRTIYSIGDGVFCSLSNSALSIREVALINTKVREWAARKSPIGFLGKKDGFYHYQVDDTVVKTIHPAHTNTLEIAPYRLIPFSHGFIVDFDCTESEGGKPYMQPARLAEAYLLAQGWLKDLQLELVPDVNAYITSGRSLDLLNIAEGIQEKKISLIADMVTHERRAVRVVLISGPSASGKTTFTQRLSTQLRINGIKPVPLSLDDYYLNVEQRPLDDEGNYDFDSVESFDLQLLHDHVLSLIEGETAETPIFDFLSGKRTENTKTMRLAPDEILIIEGLHALNPRLLSISNRNIFFKIYVSALFGINIDYLNRVPTTDARLIRRMVRGYRYRGVSPERTFELWVNVRKGEERNVFRYQEDADVMFNSTLIYELNALRPFAETILKQVAEDSPHHNTKERLLDLLSFFEPFDVYKVPFNSILREFIGDSVFLTKRFFKQVK